MSRGGRGARPPAPEPPSSAEAAGLRPAGAALRKARVQQGLSVDQIASATRIQRAHLEAIERGDADALPSGPFVKGFVTSYGRHLGLDPAELQRLMDQPPPTVSALREAEEGPAEAEEAPPPRLHRRRPVLVLAAVAGVAAVVAVAVSRQAPDGAATEAPPPLALEPSSEGGPRAESERIVRVASVEDEGGQRYVVFADLERKDAPHEVELAARHRSFVRVSEGMGGPATFEGIVEAGETQRFSSPTALFMVLGNAGAVDLTYDGQKLTDLGPDGDRGAFAFRGP